MPSFPWPRHLDRVRRIALIKPSALGDIVHALPVLHALRWRFPGACITWVVNKVYQELLDGHPALNDTLAFDRGSGLRSLPRSAASFLFLLHELRQRRYDLVVDLQGLLRSGLMTLASGAPVRIGLDDAREGARSAYNIVVDTGRWEQHAVDRYWRVAEILGAGGLPKRFDLPAWEQERAWAAAQLRKGPRPWIVFHLGGRWETKRWPVASFARLAAQAVGDFGGTAVLVGTASESALGAEFSTLFRGHCINLQGRTTLRQLVAVIRWADVVVSNDSGPLHLAVAADRPVVAPFLCTSPARTGPYRREDSAIVTGVACRASYLKRCHRLDCMRELTWQRLWPTLRTVLATWRSQTA